MIADGSVVNENGDIVFFTIERFVRDICDGNKCFICGADPAITAFNDEHVIPDWIQRKYNLHSRTITLPNNATLKYGQYKIPCCEGCNTRMSVTFETPISRILEGGYGNVVRHLQTDGPWLLFRWLALIFLKTHLKDKFLRFHLDKRKGSEPISELYAWEELHHIHCVARSFFSDAVMDDGVLGSFYVLPAQLSDAYESFDYRDLYDARTVLLCLGDTCLIAVLNDSGIARHAFQSYFDKITGALSPIQLREVMSHLAHINNLVKVRPRFGSRVMFNDRYYIHADVPATIELAEGGQELFGETLFACTADILGQFQNSDIEVIRRDVRAGKRTFLFDSDGKFLTDSMEPLRG
jgi:hypothetical protein